jgi:hypothetical protein
LDKANNVPVPGETPSDERISGFKSCGKQSSGILSIVFCEKATPGYEILPVPVLYGKGIMAAELIVYKLALHYVER